MSTLALNREYELLLPTSYVEIEKDEMEYVDGGSISLSMSSSYLNKQMCLATADILIRGGHVKEMTLTDIAKEIYAHAFAYYNASTLLGAGVIAVPIIYYLLDHANPIDIVDGGDTAIRKAAFSTIWNAF